MWCPPSQRGQSHTSLWFASEASQRVHAPFAFPSPSLALAGRRKMSVHRSLRDRNKANIRGQPLAAEGDKKMERAKLASGKKLEPTETKHRRLPRTKTERKPKAEKLVCRYCGSDDLAPALPSDAIDGVGSVSANAMDRPQLRRSRAPKSSAEGCDEGSGSQTLGPFFIRVILSAGPCPAERFRRRESREYGTLR